MVENIILTIGEDIKQKILMKYIFLNNQNLKHYYKNVINLIYDCIYEDLEELDDTFDVEDIKKLDKCVYDGNPLLVIRCNEFMEGYVIVEE